MNEQFRPIESAHCSAFETLVQRVLDGERPITDLDHSHSHACKPCRELAISAHLLSKGLTDSLTAIPTIDFASRIVPSVLANRQRERSTRRTIVAVAASLAACVAVAVFTLPQHSNGPAVASQSNPSSAEPKPPQIVESFRMAGSAFVSFTRRAATESLEPAKNLLVGIERPDPPLPVTRPLAGLPTTSPVEPITNTAKRAINLFIRDVGGLAPSPNMKS